MTMTPEMIREHTSKGWSIRPINDSDDRDELDRADFENLIDERADQEACNIFGGVALEPDNTTTQISLF